MTDNETSSLTGVEPRFNIDKVTLLPVDGAQVLIAKGIKISKKSQGSVLERTSYMPNLKFDYLDLQTDELIDPLLALDIQKPILAKLSRIMEGFSGVRTPDDLTLLADNNPYVDQSMILGRIVRKVFGKNKDLKIQFLAKIAKEADKPFLVIRGHGATSKDMAGMGEWELGNVTGKEKTQLKTLLGNKDLIDINKYSAILLFSCNSAKISFQAESSNRYNSTPIFYVVGNTGDPRRYPEYVNLERDAANG